MNVWWTVGRRPRACRPSASATASTGRRTTWRSSSASPSRTPASAPPASTTRRGCWSGRSDGQRPLPAAARTDRRRPGARAPRPRRDVPPARLLPDRDQRALVGVPVVVPALRRADRALPPRAAGVPRHQRGERRRVRRRPRRRSRPATPLELEEGAAEYAPQVIHSLVTGTAREIHGNVVNRGLIDNLPQGPSSRCPRSSTPTASAVADGRAARAVRRAQPLLPLGRRAHHRGRPHRRPEPAPPGRARRPERVVHPHARADLGAVRRPRRRPTATCCPSRSREPSPRARCDPGPHGDLVDAAVRGRTAVVAST